jgi:hypothetical protein
MYMLNFDLKGEKNGNEEEETASMNLIATK